MIDRIIYFLFTSALFAFTVINLLTLNVYDKPELWEARGSIGQVVFAALTLVSTLLIYRRQNELSKKQTEIAETQKEMTRKQFNFSLYEKRYNLYTEILDMINQSISDEPEYDPANLKGNCIESIEYDWRARENWYRLKLAKEKISFLFDDKFSKTIEAIVEKAIKDSDELIKIHMNHVNDVYTKPNRNELEWCRKIQDKQKEARDIRDEFASKFKEYLSFENL